MVPIRLKTLYLSCRPLYGTSFCERSLIFQMACRLTKILRSFDDYVKDRGRELWNNISSKTRIYLDTNFWITLRDVRAGYNETDDARRVYAKLQELHGQGRIVCPISDVVFLELERQKDQRTKLAMAQVIDEFCDGIIIKSFFDRMTEEFSAFIRCAIEGKTPPYLPALSGVWAKLPYIIGSFSVQTGLDKHTENVALKAFYDFISQIRFEELVDVLGPPPPDINEEFESWTVLAEKLNTDKRTYTEIGTPINRLHSEEIGGVVSALGPHLGEVTLSIIRELYPDRAGEVSHQEATDLAQRVVFNVFRHRKNKMAVWLPTYHIQASLHAAYRRDVARNFKPNDFLDFKHATAALPYCDIFATDGPLATVIKSGSVRLDELYSTKVVSSLGDLESSLYR